MKAGGEVAIGCQGAFTRFHPHGCLSAISLALASAFVVPPAAAADGLIVATVQRVSAQLLATPL